MFEYMLGSVLVLFTLCLRLVTVNSMKAQRNQVRQADGELRKIAGELNEVVDELQQVERQKRQYDFRRSRLLSQMEVARCELERLRRPASERLAA
ncbi:MAG: hypothetical protein ACI906_001379 [Candidatus Latescibacterota bacterium]